MKLIFVILIGLCSISNSLHSQNLEPLEIEGLTPVWDHVVIDLFQADIEGYEGSAHLGAFKSIENNNYTYHAFRAFAEFYNGVYVECRDRQSGELAWWNYVGEDNGGIKIDVNELLFNADGDIEIVCFKDLDAPAAANSSYRLCQPAAYVFDKDDGTLISEHYEQPYTGVDSIYWLDYQSDIFKSNDGYIYTLYNKVGNKRRYENMYFSEDGVLESKDSILVDIEYASFNLSTPEKLDHNMGFVNLRYSSERTQLTALSDSLFDIYSLYLDVFDENFDFKESIDIEEYMPYNWYFDSPQILENEIMISCYDSFSVQNVQPYIANVFFDLEGNYLRTVDWSNYKLDRLVVATLPNNNGYLYLIRDIDATNNTIEVEFFKASNDGALEELSSFNIQKWRKINPIEMDVSEDNQVNLLYRNNYVDTIEWKNRIGDYVLASFAFEDIGLVLSSTDDQPIADLHNTSITPNPSQGISTLTMTEPFTGELQVMDVMGKRIYQARLDDVRDYSLDIEGLQAQTYIITLTDDDGRVETLQWQVML